MGKKSRAIRKFIAAFLPVSMVLTSLYGCVGSPLPGRQGSPTNALKENPYKFVKTDLEKFRSTIRPIDSGAELSYQLGIFFQKRKKHPQAIAQFKKAIEAATLYVEAYNALGVSHDHLGEYETAQNYYLTALRVNPNLAYVQNNLGYSYLLQGKFDEAIEAFDGSLAIDGDNQRYRNNLGLAYLRNGMYEAAVNQFALVDDMDSAKAKADRLARSNRLWGEQTNGYVKKETNIRQKKDEVVVSQAREQQSEKRESTKGLKENRLPDGNSLNFADKNMVDDGEIASVEIIHYEQSKVSDIESQPIEDESTIQIEENHDAMMIGRKGEDGNVTIYYKNDMPNTNDNKRVGIDIEIGENDKESKEIDTKNIITTVVVAPYDDQAHYEKAYLTQVEVSEKTENKVMKLSVEVANGNGVKGMARRFANYLSTKGVDINKVTNANSFDHLTSKIIYQTEKVEEVYSLLGVLPCEIDRDDLIRVTNGGAHLRIILGKDVVNIEKNNDHINNNTLVAKK